MGGDLGIAVDPSLESFRLGRCALLRRRTARLPRTMDESHNFTIQTQTRRNDCRPPKAARGILRLSQIAGAVAPSYRSILCLLGMLKRLAARRPSGQPRTARDLACQIGRATHITSARDAERTSAFHRLCLQSSHSAFGQIRPLQMPRLEVRIGQGGLPWLGESHPTGGSLKSATQNASASTAWISFGRVQSSDGAPRDCQKSNRRHNLAARGWAHRGSQILQKLPPS